MSPSPKEVRRVKSLTFSTEIVAETSGITGAGNDGLAEVGIRVGDGVFVGTDRLSVVGCGKPAAGAHAETKKIKIRNTEIENDLCNSSPILID